jgi:hypothetical protein
VAIIMIIAILPRIFTRRTPTIARQAGNPMAKATTIMIAAARPLSR